MLIDEGALARSNGNWTASRDLASLAVPPRSRLCCRRAWMGWEERTARSWSAARWREPCSIVMPSRRLPRRVCGGGRPEPPDADPPRVRIPDRAELTGREAFRFRHQLIRDAAYQAIAKQSRAELHERYADWLESALGERLDEYRPILAYHLEQAARYRRELDAADPVLAGLARRAAGHLARPAPPRWTVETPRPRPTSCSVPSHWSMPIRHRALPWRLLAGEAMVTGATAEEANAFLKRQR